MRSSPALATGHRIGSCLWVPRRKLGTPPSHSAKSVRQASPANRSAKWHRQARVIRSSPVLGYRSSHRKSSVGSASQAGTTAKPHRQATPPSHSAKPLRQVTPPITTYKVESRSGSRPSHRKSSVGSSSQAGTTAKPHRQVSSQCLGLITGPPSTTTPPEYGCACRQIGSRRVNTKVG
jgi:hypothetical protein